MFMNGVNAGTLTSANSMTISTNHVLIGERDGAQSFPVSGNLDEFAFWNRSLSDTEVATLFNGGAGISLTAVPEPAVLPFLCAIAAGCFQRRRRSA